MINLTKVNTALNIAVLIFLIMFIWHFTHPTPAPCEHSEHSCMQVGHKYETHTSNTWGSGDAENRVNQYKVHELTCKVCGEHTSQKVIINGNKM